MSGQTLGIKYDTFKDENGEEILIEKTGPPMINKDSPLRPILIDISQGLKG